MRRSLLPLCAILLASQVNAATDVRVDFTLKTTDAHGSPIEENRHYYVYRPDGLPRATPLPMILVFEAGGGSAPASFLHRKADQAGFVVVSCSFSGNATGTPGSVWTSDNPRIVGYEDIDYVDEVIRRVRASDNCDDAFTVGLSKGGHMSLFYACERPSMIKAAASVDEFMQLTANIPTAPLPIIVFQGTLDTNVPYTMVKDTVDVWRAVNGLLKAAPVTTYEASPLIPGNVSQATWRGGAGGTQVAFVTIVGGTHTYATPQKQTGYDFASGMWAFFSQFLTSRPGAPKIVSQPVDNIQICGQPASFWVVAAGSGPLRYQWQKNGENIQGATANWLTVPATVGENGATFRAVASNDSGAAISVAAKLTVKPPPEGPTITRQPADQAAVAGQPVSFTVAARGTPPLSYQWKKNGVDIDGATAASLAIPAISPDCGASFSVVVKDSSGSSISAPATLTVTPTRGAPIMVKNVERARVLVDQKATFSVTAWSASPMRYQWQKGTFNGNMMDIPGATGPAYTTLLSAPTSHPMLFRCTVSNAAGNVTSAGEMLMVTTADRAPNKITSAITAAAQTGAPFRYTITSSGGTAPITYSAGPLPPGLSIDQKSGQISGKASHTGTSRIVMDASNSVGHISATLTLMVTETPPPVSIDAWRLANFGASATDPSIAGDTADPDGDGYSNLDEFKSGSNPLDASSAPHSGKASPE